MNLGQGLARARRTLEDGGIADAPLEGEILLRHTLGISRARLFADLSQELEPSLEKLLDKILERRLKGEPSAYITGHREFYGLDFLVDKNVLIPRPETELLVDKALTLARGRRIAAIADIGTGCGAIAVSLAVHLPEVTIYATDISEKALKVAAENGRRHGVAARIAFLPGDLLAPLPVSVDVIIANLPYVREADLTPGGPLDQEPSLALNGGRDGLDRIRKLCQQAGARLNAGGSLLLEVGQGQAGSVAARLGQSFPSSRIEIGRDLAGIERIVSLRLTGPRTRC